MTVDKEPISVHEIMMAKKRKWFFVSSVAFFLICCALAFWILPRFTDLARQVGAESGKPLPAAVEFMMGLAGWFKVLWVFIGIGLGALCVMVWRGYFDNFLPILSLAVLVAGMAAVGLAFYAFYLPAISLIDQVK